MKSILEVTGFEGKKVLVRAEYDVPLVDGKVVSVHADRILASFETVDYLSAVGARVVIISHIGRDGVSLEPVAEYIRSTGRTITFVKDIVGDVAKKAIAEMSNGDMILLENLRTNPDEEGNDEVFAQALAAHGEMYINEAFSASHREHASIVGIPKYLPSYSGNHFDKEYEALSRFQSVQHPFVLIAGGAKFETKLPLIEKFLPLVDTLVLGGALANTLLLKRGYPVGKSVVDSEADVDAILASPKLFLPDRVVVNRSGGAVEVAIQDVGPDDVIVDISPNSLERIASQIASARMVLWNGPLGWYEKGFTASSEKIAALVRGSQGFSVAGGGDTIALFREKIIDGIFSFESLSGGAMLEFLAEGTLPGIEALS